jgi:hypothetical protein
MLALGSAIDGAAELLAVCRPPGREGQMTARASFRVESGEVVIRARLEWDDGTIGDMIDYMGPGGRFFGLTYEELWDSGAGSILVGDDGSAQIEK